MQLDLTINETRPSEGDESALAFGLSEQVYCWLLDEPSIVGENESPIRDTSGLEDS
jgi:hypothetical protein